MHHIVFVFWMVSLAVQTPVEDPTNPYSPTMKSDTIKQLAHKAFDEKDEKVATKKAQDFINACKDEKIRKRMRIVELED